MNQPIWNPYYAIEHIPSGNLLPVPTELSRGFTRVEVGDTGIPRLFLNSRTAERALTQWLRGACEMRWYGRGEDAESDFVITPKPDRIRSDMRVIPIALTKGGKRA